MRCEKCPERKKQGLNLLANLNHKFTKKVSALIKTENLSFKYRAEDNEKLILDGIDLEIKKGEFVCILGHNGSGKSTLAKHMNAILLPTGGKVYVSGIDTSDADRLWDIRQNTAFVFQNPDNQIVATIVEEDVAFACENLGIEPKEIRQRVDDALKTVGLSKYASYAPHRLSGGQKQKVAIAGVIAMRPKTIVFDEPTAMLDPIGRRDVLKTIKKLNKEMGITIVLITHNMDEAAQSDRIVIMNSGEIVSDDTPRNTFSNVEKMIELGLDTPQVTRLCHELNKRGINIPETVITVEECANEIMKIASPSLPFPDLSHIKKKEDIWNTKEDIIKVENLSHIYQEKSPFEKVALKNISLSVKKGSFVGIIGHTGSGKSTLIQHLNGLMKASEGSIYVDGMSVTDKNTDMKAIRRKVGLVFQYPEYQLFEETVYKDIAYGPKNMGKSDEEIHTLVTHAAEMVGLKEKHLQKSPFELSGGQKRRVAIAGVLAMKPSIIILDEPCAGLDPKGRDDILEKLKLINKEENITVITVSHSMEDVAKTADSVIVMNEGELVMQNTVAEVFKNTSMLQDIGLNVPEVSLLFGILKEKGLNVPLDVYTVNYATEVLCAFLKGGGLL